METQQGTDNATTIHVPVILDTRRVVEVSGFGVKVRAYLCFSTLLFIFFALNVQMFLFPFVCFSGKVT